jgi:hypothetical protein
MRGGSWFASHSSGDACLTRPIGYATFAEYFEILPVRGPAMLALQVIIWMCVGLFLCTSIISIAALIGKLKLGRTAEAHDYFLKRLFVGLLLEVVAASIFGYAQFIKSVQIPLSETPPAIVEVEKHVQDIDGRVKQLEQKASSPAPKKHWELVRTGDCSGNDFSQSPSSDPDEAKCTDPNFTAVCWDNQLFKNGGTAWCTYKRIALAACNGGSASGRMYQCKP